MRSLCTAFAVLMCSAGSCVFAASCADLAKLNPPKTTVTVAQVVPAGPFTPPEGQAIAQVPEFCRVAGSIKPTDDSDIRFEVWMPATGWNGKFQGIGNGGFAGGISYGGLGQAVSKGYATASTDTGHHAIGTDASWALGHPEKIADFGYRAIHETAAKAKTIITAFYGNAPRRSYFNSCSNGGRQALMEAQRFPADYDGIIAGAPANYWTRLLSLGASDVQALQNDPASYIPPSKIPAIGAAVLAACDTQDGAADGILSDPTQCHFDPASIACKDAESDSCLTAPQVTALKKIYDGLRNGKGEKIFPGYEPGGEAGFGGWPLWITGQKPSTSLLYAFSTGYFSNIVYGDASWDFHKFNVDASLADAEKKTAGTLNAISPDVDAFRKRGGKLILYHGWADAAIPPLN